MISQYNGGEEEKGKWRVCVDFTDLNKACPKDPFPMLRVDQLVDATVNKACPKDPFPMLRVDQLVDATVSHPQMSFLDAFQGYHQIPLALDD